MSRLGKRGVVHPANLVVVLLGIIALAAGLAGAVGVIPGANTVCLPGQTCASCYVEVNFTVSATGLRATETDASTVVVGSTGQNPTPVVTLNWGGQGTGTTGGITPGSTNEWTYSNAGTYSVTETATTLDLCAPVHAESLTISLTVPGSTTNSTAYTLKAGFSLTADNQSVTLRDDTQVSNNLEYVGELVAWGDSGTSSLSGTGGVASHTYSPAPCPTSSCSQTYTVTETATGTVSSTGLVVQSTAAQSLTITYGPGSAPPPPPPTPTTSAFVLNALTLSLIAAGLALIVVPFIGKPGAKEWGYRIAGVVVVFAVALTAGYFIGGPGPL